ncbi:MAG: beta-lactamase family protein, partial [Nitrospinae bacterium]|nr:beta-lactamase family protein [Nitrospinota bacterium]
MILFPGFMARFAIAALCVITLASCAVAPKKPDKFTPGDYSFVKRHISWLIKREADKRGIRGVSVALVDSGETVWAEGFGFADEAGKKPATERTLYRVGSISKLFTMLGVMKLSENGRVNIDGAIADYIPGFSIKTRFADAPPITIRSVLTHHSGLPSDYAKGMWTDKPERFTSLIGLLKEEYAANPPGLVFSYSNVGFTLLGAVIENASGSRYEDYMDTHLLGPIGMKDSAFEIKPAMEP